jgi:hypothetical protein
MPTLAISGLTMPRHREGNGNEVIPNRPREVQANDTHDAPRVVDAVTNRPEGGR